MGLSYINWAGQKAGENANYVAEVAAKKAEESGLTTEVVSERAKVLGSNFYDM